MQLSVPITVALCAAGLAGCERKVSPPPTQATLGAQESLALSPIPGDTIAIGSYVQFVRPLRNLGVQASDSDDFRPYNAEMEPDTFAFVAAAERYVVAPSGAGRLFANSGTSRAFALPVDSGLFVERLAFTRVNGDPVFVVQETDNEGAAGFVVRLDNANLHQQWKARVPGFNIGFALRDGDFLYVTCFGFVGKLDLNSGQYAWRHGDLYATEKFNAFDRPRIRGDIVEFPAGGRTLRVERQTGQRLTP